jgi:hypothetical protein
MEKMKLKKEEILFSYMTLEIEINSLIFIGLHKLKLKSKFF